MDTSIDECAQKKLFWYGFTSLINTNINNIISYELPCKVHERADGRLGGQGHLYAHEWSGPSSLRGPTSKTTHCQVHTEILKRWNDCTCVHSYTDINVTIIASQGGWLNTRQPSQAKRSSSIVSTLNPLAWVQLYEIINSQDFSMHSEFLISPSLKIAEKSPLNFVTFQDSRG